MTPVQTAPAARPPSGTRARATLGKNRCREPRLTDGRPCQRLAGSGTKHPGEGPCSNHDDGSWSAAPFAENAEARASLLEVIRSRPGMPLREAAERVGYHRPEVKALLDADETFAEAYAHARGYDADSLRTVVHQRAIDGSDRLLEFEAKMRLPEARELRRSYHEGQLDVRAIPYLDLAKLDEHDLAELSRIFTKGQPEPADLPREGRPALELLDGSG